MIIKLKNLRLKTIIGIHKWEDSIQREIIINTEIEIDDAKSMQSDDIRDTIDYDVITDNIKKFIGSNRFRLVEKMTASLIDLIMEDKRIKRCKLELDKVGAIPDLESFSITEIRERKDI